MILKYHFNFFSCFFLHDAVNLVLNGWATHVITEFFHICATCGRCWTVRNFSRLQWPEPLSWTDVSLSASATHPNRHVIPGVCVWDVWRVKAHDTNLCWCFRWGCRRSPNPPVLCSTREHTTASERLCPKRWITHTHTQPIISVEMFTEYVTDRRVISHKYPGS